MSIITTHAETIFDRAADMAPVMRSIDRHLTAELDQALLGVSGGQGGSPRSAPQCKTCRGSGAAPVGPCGPCEGTGHYIDPEPPTGHPDATGDIAVSGAVNAIRNKQTALIAAELGVLKAFDHLERAATAAISSRPTDPARRPDNAELCTGPQCNRLKEVGQVLCVECGIAHANFEREQAHPVCFIFECDRPVERYTTAAGVAYVGMIFDGEQWLPSSGALPICAAHRKRDYDALARKGTEAAA